MLRNGRISSLSGRNSGSSSLQSSSLAFSSFSSKRVLYYDQYWFIINKYYQLFFIFLVRSDNIAVLFTSFQTRNLAKIVLCIEYKIKYTFLTKFFIGNMLHHHLQHLSINIIMKISIIKKMGKTHSRSSMVSTAINFSNFLFHLWSEPLCKSI